MDNGLRDIMLGHLAEAVATVEVAHPTRVAVDGPPAAGKTTLADDLAAVLRAQGREVIRATRAFCFPKHSDIGAASSRLTAAITTPTITRA